MCSMMGLKLACVHVCMHDPLTTYNIYGSALTIKPYVTVSSTLEDIAIICISYCDSRNIFSSWIR